ncbi:hypothetical protein ACLOJK_002310 [Asimina triloba]
MKLIEMAIKGQKKIGEALCRRFSCSRDGETTGANSRFNCTRLVAEKGHFVVYTNDRMRFVVPLEYLSSSIFKELLRKSEDEFGLSCGGPITLPLPADFMEYTLSFMGKSISKDVEKALLYSIATGG